MLRRWFCLVTLAATLGFCADNPLAPEPGETKLEAADAEKTLASLRVFKAQGFVSGYRGSPLGMVDQAIWKAGPKFTEAGIRFVPAINEELAATQVLSTQRVESDPERTVDGVFAMWYGKGPGVDRAGADHVHADVRAPQLFGQ